MTERNDGRAKLPLSQRFGRSLTLPFPKSRSVMKNHHRHRFTSVHYTAPIEAVRVKYKRRDTSNKTWFRLWGSKRGVRSTLRAVPATVPDPFLNHAQPVTVEEALTGIVGWRYVAGIREFLIYGRLAQLVRDALA